MFESWMDAETRRRLKADWVAQHKQNGAPWSGSDDELDRAFVIYDADGPPSSCDSRTDFASRIRPSAPRVAPLDARG